MHVFLLTQVSKHWGSKVNILG